MMNRYFKRIAAMAMGCLLGLHSLPAQQVVVTRAYTVQSGAIEQVAVELRKALKDKATVTVDAHNGTLLVAAESFIHTELERALKAQAAKAGGTPKTVLPHTPASSSPPPTNFADRASSLELAQASVQSPQNTANASAAGPSEPQQKQQESPARPLATPATANQQTITLQHISPQQLSQTIQRLLQNQSKTSTEGNQTIISAVGRDGQPVQFVIENTTGQVQLRGNLVTRVAWQRVLNAIDRPANADRTELVSVTGRKPPAVQRALQLIEQQNAVSGKRETPRRQQIVQWRAGRPLPQRDVGVRVAQNQPAAGQAPPAEAGGEQAKGLLGPVQIVYLEGLDVIVLRGNPQDVARVQAIIDEIESLSAITEPTIEVYELKHANSQAMADLVNPLYEQVLSPRQGQVSITPLVQPNSILLVGRADSVRIVRELVEKLDKPTTPEAQFHVFRLKYMNATDAERTITSFYEERGGLGTRVRVTSDARSNAIILQAGPRDAQEVSDLLEGMDVEASSVKQSMQVFRLRYSLAEELAPILQEALQGEQQQTAAPDATGVQPRATMLSLLTVDAQGQRLLKSGILSNVTITAETQMNAIIARGPENTMPLIEALIRQLDELPSEDAEVKVFTLNHGDAVLLTDLLNQLFGNQLAGGGGFQTNQNQGGGQNPLIPLRFTVDERTNSIVATGSLQDLRVVEAILLRLDQEDVSNRRNVVFRLRYAPAVDVATAVNEFLTNERSITEVAPNTVTPFKQIEREVVVVPEPVSNSLIVSATPKYFDQINEIVQQLDERPPMVMMQLLIAEVDLNRFAELGIELGLQDSLLFDRGVVDGTTGEVTPGFNFNNQPLGNVPFSPSSAAGQGITDFALDRINDELGFGGLVLSVSSDSISMLVRALEQDSRLQVLSRPQIMTLDTQTAFVQIGQRVPRVTSSQLTQFGTINNTVLEDVGIVFGVTPRVSSDGLIVMEIDAEKSELDEDSPGIPIAISQSGEVIFSPIINTKTAQATVAARSGQTVIFGGFISEVDASIERGVPYVSDIPLLGELFQYKIQDCRRSELLFILTPYVIRSDQDIDCLNQMETERMSWCLSDVYRIHGYFDVQACEGGLGLNCETVTEIYPDQSPSHVDFPSVEQLPSANPATENLFQSPSQSTPRLQRPSQNGQLPNGFGNPSLQGPSLEPSGTN